MDLVECVGQMYYSIVINELKRMRTSGLYRGVSYNGLLYMDLIRQMDNPTVSSIAETLGVAKSSVSQKVSELECRGLVNRERDALDGRVSHVSIAPEAVDDVSAIDAPIRAALESVSRDYSEEQIHTLCAMITSLSLVRLDAQTQAADRR
jgi:DNA-binding MarR family transcriptional regulator